MQKDKHWTITTDVVIVFNYKFANIPFTNTLSTLPISLMQPIVSYASPTIQLSTLLLNHLPYTINSLSFTSIYSTWYVKSPTLTGVTI